VKKKTFVPFWHCAKVRSSFGPRSKKLTLFYKGEEEKKKVMKKFRILDKSGVVSKLSKSVVLVGKNVFLKNCLIAFVI
jgi:hypothetical protein